jgi:cell division protein FtsW
MTFLENIRDLGGRLTGPGMVGAAQAVLVAAVLFLLAIGVVMVYSATSVSLVAAGTWPFKDALMQFIYACIGLIFASVIWRAIPPAAWQGPLSVVALGVGVVLILAVWLFGTEYYGAKRWLYVGPFGLQPSELVKIIMVIVASKILFDWREQNITPRACLFQLAFAVGLPLLVMYKTQSDLGTTLVCAVGILTVLWLAGVSWQLFAGIVVVGVLAVCVAIFGTGYRSDRLVFIDPWNDGDSGYGSGFNLIRALYAIAEGGLFGSGVGASHEKYSYLFAADCDFVYAVICDELGAIGGIIVIVLFLLILWAGVTIAKNAASAHGAFLAGGCTIMLVFQAFLNICCTVGVAPTTGKPLPFISSGGTSVIASLCMVGLILSVGREVAGTKSVYEKNRENLRIVS